MRRSVDQQMRSYSPAPADATHLEVIGRVHDVIRVRSGRRIQQLVIRMAADSVETCGLVGRDVIGTLQVAIVEGDIVGGVVQAAAQQGAKITLARGRETASPRVR